LLTFVKALRPRQLIFTVAAKGIERPRYNFQLKLLSYTEEGRKLAMPADALAAQHKLSIFVKKPTTLLETRERPVEIKKRKFYEIDCLDEMSERTDGDQETQERKPQTIESMLAKVI
jgi:hypothetical protein